MAKEYIDKLEAERRIVYAFNNYSGDGYNADYVNGYENGLIDAQNFVRNVPAADVRPVVRGKWELFCGGLDWQCSNCNWSTRADIPRNFCPNCGADMREES